MAAEREEASNDDFDANGATDAAASDLVTSIAEKTADVEAIRLARAAETENLLADAEATKLLARAAETANLLADDAEATKLLADAEAGKLLTVTEAGKRAADAEEELRRYRREIEFRDRNTGRGNGSANTRVAFADMSGNFSPIGRESSLFPYSPTSFPYDNNNNDNTNNNNNSSNNNSSSSSASTKALNRSSIFDVVPQKRAQSAPMTEPVLSDYVKPLTSLEANHVRDFVISNNSYRALGGTLAPGILINETLRHALEIRFKVFKADEVITMDTQALYDYLHAYKPISGITSVAAYLGIRHRAPFLTVHSHNKYSADLTKAWETDTITDERARKSFYLKNLGDDTVKALFQTKASEKDVKVSDLVSLVDAHLKRVEEAHELTQISGGRQTHQQRELWSPQGERGRQRGSGSPHHAGARASDGRMGPRYAPYNNRNHAPPNWTSQQGTQQSGRSVSPWHQSHQQHHDRHGNFPLMTRDAISSSTQSFNRGGLSRAPGRGPAQGNRDGNSARSSGGERAQSIQYSDSARGNFQSSHYGGSARGNVQGSHYGGSARGNVQSARGGDRGGRTGFRGMPSHRGGRGRSSGGRVYVVGGYYESEAVVSQIASTDVQFEEEVFHEAQEWPTEESAMYLHDHWGEDPHAYDEESRVPQGYYDPQEGQFWDCEEEQYNNRVVYAIAAERKPVFVFDNIAHGRNGDPIVLDNALSSCVAAVARSSSKTSFVLPMKILEHIDGDTAEAVTGDILIDTGCESLTNLISEEKANELIALGIAVLPSNMRMTGAFNGSSSSSKGRIECSLIIQVSAGCELVVIDIFEIVEKLPDGANGFDSILGAYACCQTKLVTSPFPAVQENYSRMATLSTAKSFTRPSLGSDAKHNMFGAGAKRLTSFASYESPEIDATARLIPIDAMPFVETEPEGYDHEFPLRHMSDEEFLKLVDINPELSAKNRKLMENFVLAHKRTFAIDAHARTFDLPLMKIVYKVEGETQKVAYRYTSFNEAQTMAQKDKCEAFLRAGILKVPVVIEQISTTLMVWQNGKWRMVHDFRNLNKIIEEPIFPQITAAEIMRFLKHAKMLTTIDLINGYHQVGLHEDSQPKACIATVLGILMYTCVMMGLAGSGAWFCYVIVSVVLLGLIQRICVAYVDDITIKADGPDEDFQTLDTIANCETVVDRFDKHNLKIQITKYHMGYRKATVMGHLVGNGRIELTPERMDLISKWPEPSTVTEWRSWWGFLNHFRYFIEGIAMLMGESRELIGDRQKGKVPMTEDLRAVFIKMRNRAMQCTYLSFIDTALPIILSADACDVGCGYVLGQPYWIEEEGKFVVRPIQMGGRRFTKGAEANMATVSKEAYGLTYAIRECHNDLKYTHFCLRTDHANLTKLLMTSANSKASIGAPQLERQAIFLTQYNCELIFQPGQCEDHIIPDVLSRTDFEKGSAIVASICSVLAIDSSNAESASDYLASEYFPSSVWNIECPDPHAGASEPNTYVCVATTRSKSKTTFTYSDITPPPSYRTDSATTETDHPVGAPDYESETELAPTPDEDNGEAAADLRPAAIRLAVPTPEAIRDALASCHNSIVGHSGAKQLLKRIRSSFPGLHITMKQCSDFVLRCGNCQINFDRHEHGIGSTRVIEEKQLTPFENWQTDHLFIGLDEQGNSYIQVWVDPVSRAVELYPKKDITAESSVYALCDIISRYGVPKIIMSDLGKDYVNKLIEQFISFMGTVKRTPKMASRPQGLAMVERKNQDILALLRALVIDNMVIRLNWTPYIPFVRRSLWLLYNRDTQLRPIDFLGGAIKLRLFENIPNEETHPSIAEIALAVESIRVIALNFQKATDFKRLAVEPTPTTIFETGSLVLVRKVNNSVSLRKHKLDPALKGPFKVTGQNGSAVMMKDLNSLKQMPNRHVSECVQFFENEHIAPHEWAANNSDMYIVDEILNHRPRKGISLAQMKIFSDVELLVKWTGFEEPSWNDSHTLLDLIALREYVLTRPELKTIFKF